MSIILIDDIVFSDIDETRKINYQLDYQKSIHYN